LARPKYPGSVRAIFRDFVNCHDKAGEKVISLILTVLVRGQNGELIATKLNDFYTDFKSAVTYNTYVKNVTHM
jgi:hypothetical protein